VVSGKVSDVVPECKAVDISLCKKQHVHLTDLREVLFKCNVC
jgi:hypothetical protein